LIGVFVATVTAGDDATDVDAGFGFPPVQLKRIPPATAIADFSMNLRRETGIG
jgi:hypothetical protein